jgi:predicted transposase YbfD/YdcC
MRVVKQLDLRDKIVTSDALLAQRELSIAIVEAGGDCVWAVKGNQGQLQRNIEILFEPEACTGDSVPATRTFRQRPPPKRGMVAWNGAR